MPAKTSAKQIDQQGSRGEMEQHDDCCAAYCCFRMYALVCITKKQSQLPMKDGKYVQCASSALGRLPPRSGRCPWDDRKLSDNTWKSGKRRGIGAGQAAHTCPEEAKCSGSAVVGAVLGPHFPPRRK
eukprot:1568230-Pleurochrysis_carterae.AAC.1